MDKPLITVGIYAYDCEQYLVQCLTTVCRQTYQNLDIIIVEDSSLDKCGFIIDTFANRDSRIQVMHCRTYEGKGAARAKIVEKARGELIYWVDGNDYLEDDAIAHSHSDLATQYHVDIVKCAHPRDKNECYGVGLKEEFQSLLLPSLVINTLDGCLIKKKLYDDIDDALIGNVEDYIAIPRLVEAAENGIFLDKDTGYFFREKVKSHVSDFMRYLGQAIYTSERYREYKVTYPEACKLVLKQFATAACNACCTTDNENATLRLKERMFEYERDVMLNDEIGKYQKYLYRSILGNGWFVKHGKRLLAASTRARAVVSKLMD